MPSGTHGAKEAQRRSSAGRGLLPANRGRGKPGARARQRSQRRAAGLAALAFAALASCLSPAPSAAFTLLFQQGPIADLEAELRAAPRWSAAPGAPSTLADGIQVWVQPGYAEAMAERGGTPQDYEAAVVAAFAAWETSELQFEVAFGGSDDAEIHLYYVDQADPFFVDNLASGVALLDTSYRGDRLLTSGQEIPGEAIVGAQIYQAVDRIHNVFDWFARRGVYAEEDRVARVQDNLVHEIGHTLGFGHPNENPLGNIDSDSDPFTVVEVDPDDPFAGLITSPNIDPDTIMRGQAPADLQAFLFTELQPDDRSGLNVLYASVPEPTAALLQLAALVTLRCVSSRRARKRACGGER